MAISYQFVNRETGQPDLLPTVDNEICKRLGIEPDEDRYSGAFIQARTIGVSLCWNKSEYDPKEIIDIIKRNWEKHETPEYIEEMTKLHLWVFGEKWQFRAWR